MATAPLAAEDNPAVLLVTSLTARDAEAAFWGSICPWQRKFSPVSRRLGA